LWPNSYSSWTASIFDTPSINSAPDTSLFVRRLDTLEEVLLFTALATWDTEKVVRHTLVIEANESAGVSVVYGEFKRKDKRCTVCKQRHPSFDKKRTDVNIALALFRYAVTDNCDRAVIVSGNTDMTSAVKAVRSAFPGKQIGVIAPIGRSSQDLVKQADFRFKMRQRPLASSRFADRIVLPDKSMPDCPAIWT